LAGMGQLEAQEVQARLLGAKATAVQLIESPIAVLQECVARVTIGADSLQITMRLDGFGAKAETAVIDVPVKLKRCGMAVRLIVGGAAAQANRALDGKLIALLARAHDWAGRLTSGRQLVSRRLPKPRTSAPPM